MPVTETISPLNRTDLLAAMPEEPAPSPDIAALTARLARGDESAWREFYDLYFNRLLRYLLVVTSGREEAAREALQLTLLRVVKYVRKFEAEEAFWSWLTVLARSSVVDEERKRKRYFAVLDRFFGRAQSTAAANPHEVEVQLQVMLEQQLERLPADERFLIERKYFAAESVKEIAGSSELTEKAVESKLVRIRRKLKNSVLAQLNDETTD